jgi:acetyl-CoA acyltransferase
VDWAALDDVLFGCANQAGEDNRNVARMSCAAGRAAGGSAGATINRLCGSGMDAVGSAARAIKRGEAQLMIAGGVESMSRAPFVMPKAESAFSRSNAVYDTTIGWRFVNRLHEGAVRRRLDARDGRERGRRVRHRARGAGPHGPGQPAQGPGGAAGRLLRRRDHAGQHPAEKGEPVVVASDEHPRETSLEALAKLKGVSNPRAP